MKMPRSKEYRDGYVMGYLTADDPEVVRRAFLAGLQWARTVVVGTNADLYKSPRQAYQAIVGAIDSEIRTVEKAKP